MSIMYLKKLIGKKCYLSPMNCEDAQKFAEWLNDLEIAVTLSMYQDIVSTEDEKERMIKLSKEHNYSIIDLKNDELIGNCGFFDLDNINQTAECGIFIGNKEYWNKGYGTEALTLLLDYGFKALNLYNVQLKVYGFNERAKRCYEKAGFKQIGIRRGALLRNLERHDIIYMDILSKEFYEKNEGK